MPELELCASALNVDPVNVTLVVSPLASLEGANPDVAVSATVASVYELEFDGCTPMEDSGAPGG